MKIIDIICENPQTDYQMRQLAMQVLRELYTRQNQPLKVAGFQMPNQGFLPVAYTGTNLPDLNIGVVLGIENPMYIDAIQLIAFPYELSPKIKNIDARKAARRGKEILPKTVGDLIKYIRQDISALVHEFTHYWDEKRGGEGYQNSKETDDDKDQPPYDRTDQIERAARPAYYNDRFERNAFFNQMISKFDKASPSFNQQPFQQWLNYIVNYTFPKGGFWEQLTPENRYRLINRAYMIWAEKQNNPIAQSGRLT